MASFRGFEPLFRIAPILDQLFGVLALRRFGSHEGTKVSRLPRSRFPPTNAYMAGVIRSRTTP